MKLPQHRIIQLLLLGFIAIVTLSVAAGLEEKDAYVVKNFTVSDVPADDGTGLVLSWTPLPRERRIIEYRVYRGVDPKQMFYLSSIPVNVKTGVASDKMYFYDSGPNELIDIRSPAKLKKEKQQGKDSPIYRSPPRDIKLLAKLAKHYNLLASMEKNHFFYRTEKNYSADISDTTVYAGLKLHQVTIRAGLKTGEKYYYTVIAVDERRTFHPHATITAGTPTDNAPEKAPRFYAVYLQDRRKLQFEWDYPLYKDDLARYQVLMLPAVSAEEWSVKKTLPDLGGLKLTPVTGGSAALYASVELNDLTAKGLTEKQITEARYCVVLYDGAGLSAYSDLAALRLTDSSELPPKPQFKVVDKPNDKGDRLTVIWSDPVVLITKVSFTSAKNDRLKINYLVNAAETQKVRNIYFDFYRKGDVKPFQTINEFFLDNIITLDIPEGYDIHQGLRVVIRMRGTPEVKKNYELEQTLDWDDKLLSLNPGKLMSDGFNLFNLQNVVYQKSPASRVFFRAKKMSSYDSNVEITIPYESLVFRPVVAVNIVEGDSLFTYGGEVEHKRKLDKKDANDSFVLVNASIDLMVDPKTKRVIRTSIYASEGKKDAEMKLKDTENKIKELKTQETELTAQVGVNPEAEQMLSKLKSQIDDLEKSLEQFKNPMLIRANEIANDRRRMRFITRTRDKDRRRATFYMLRTDGKGLFIESDYQKDEDQEYLYKAPIANWFDGNKMTALFATLIFGIMVFIFVRKARKGHDLYIRPIAGIHEIDNAIGRATEMGRPILYIMGSGSLSDVPIIASLGILSQVAKKAAEYDTRLIVPCYDFIVMPVAQEVVREAHYEAGRPDSYDKNNVFFLTQVQFAYVAGVNGIMIREKVATNFFLGFFAAEALLMTETGNAVGAIQIAGSDAVTQIPFFITTCDYTLIGEELYAASAYLKREPMLLGTLKAQDYYKFLILSCIIIGVVLSSFQVTNFIDIFPLR